MLMFGLMWLKLGIVHIVLNLVPDTPNYSLFPYYKSIIITFMEINIRKES